MEYARLGSYGRSPQRAFHIAYMLGRKQEINLQASQILDSLLIALAFWICHSLRFYNPLGWFGPENIQIPEFREFFWLMAIVVPFTPVVLEMNGYYDHPLQKTVWKLSLIHI